MKHPLMQNNITNSDTKALIEFLKKKPRLTSGKKVLEFEKKWSNWLGIKYSVFVNSGSSANLLSIAYLKYLYPKGGEIIVPALTWVSDIASIIQNGFTPVLVDVNINNLALNFKEIKKKYTKKTKAIFLTHILGLNGLSQDILKFCKSKKIILIEDVCESHGATFKNKKLGTFGLMSNFSFYYAHHMTTIEGGMICTNNKSVYQILRMLRSHGLVRELNDIKYKNFLLKKNLDLNKEFIFHLPAYNVRSTEINAVLGINQLKSLNKNNQLRRNNFKYFLNLLDGSKYFKNFETEGSCNYAFIILFNPKFRKKLISSKFEKYLQKNGIEFRRGTSGGGNQARQPYIKNLLIKNYYKKLKNTETIHFYGYYIGNYPSLSKKKIKKICKILNSFK